MNGAEILALPPMVLDALHDANHTGLSRSTSWRAYLQTRWQKPGLCRADGTLTKRGQAVADWLHDNRYTPTGVIE